MLPHRRAERDIEASYPAAIPEEDDSGEPDVTPQEELADPMTRWGRKAWGHKAEDGSCALVTNEPGAQEQQAAALGEVPPAGTAAQDPAAKDGAGAPQTRGADAVGECKGDPPPLAGSMVEPLSVRLDGAHKEERGRCVYGPLSVQHTAQTSTREHCVYEPLSVQHAVQAHLTGVSEHRMYEPLSVRHLMRAQHAGADALYPQPSVRSIDATVCVSVF